VTRRRVGALSDPRLKEAFMADLHDERSPFLERLRRRHQESNAILTVAMAGLAALFVFAAVMAYHYVSTGGDIPQRSQASIGGSATTGSGGANKPLAR
jgi:hypothetical protein